MMRHHKDVGLVPDHKAALITDKLINGIHMRMHTEYVKKPHIINFIDAEKAFHKAHQPLH